MAKYVFVAMLLVVFCTTAALAVTGPANGWGKSHDSFSSVSGNYSSLGWIYDPANYTWVLGSDTPGEDGGFTVTADVEMWCDMGLTATDIYFHIGGDLGANPSLSQDIPGYLSSNNGQYLFVTKKNAKISESDITTLEFKNNVLGGTTPANAPAIPVVWSLQDTVGGEFRTGQYSTGGNNGNLYGVTWLLNNGDAGMHNFVIKCTIKPDRYQPDGHYEMDPILVGSPEM